MPKPQPPRTRARTVRRDGPVRFDADQAGGVTVTHQGRAYKPGTLGDYLTRRNAGG